jgi:hypothetical protein
MRGLQPRGITMPPLAINYCRSSKVNCGTTSSAAHQNKKSISIIPGYARLAASQYCYVAFGDRILL